MTPKTPTLSMDELEITDSILIRRMRVFSRYASAVGVLAGCAALIGWTFDVPALKSTLPKLVTMKPNTAVGFILLGVSLWLLQIEPDRVPNKARLRIAQACASVVALLGLLTLIEYFAGRDLGIDQLLFTEQSGVVGTFRPGRMAPNTAFCLVLLGSALLLLDVETRGHRPSQVLSMTAGLVGLLALLGYTYGISVLHEISHYTDMALHTAGALVVLSAGILCARTDRGLMVIVTSESPGGIVIRRLLPPAIAITLAIGWLIAAAERAMPHDDALGLSLLAILAIVIFTFLVFVTSASLHRSDIRRRHDNERLKILSDTAATLLYADSPQTIIYALYENVSSYLELDVFFNYLVDDKEGRLHLNAYGGIPEEVAKKVEWLDHGMSVCGCVARDGCKIVAENIPDTPDERTEFVRSHGVKAYACYPLLSQGEKVIGTLSFGTRKRSTFTEDELALMKTVTDQIAIAIEHARLYQTEKMQRWQLQEKNQQLQGLFDSAPAGIALFDAEPPYKVLAHNRIYQQFWDEPFKTEGMVGRCIPDYAPMPEESGIFQVFREVAETQKGKTIYEFPYDGMERGRTWWNWNLSPVIQEGKVVAFAHMLIEVTDHVLARDRIQDMLEIEQEQTEELRAQGEELAAANEELAATNDELATLNEQLREANDTLQLVNDLAADFLAGATLEHSLETMLVTARKLVAAGAASIAIYQNPDVLKTRVYDLGGEQCEIESPLGVGDCFPRIATRYSHGLVIQSDLNGSVPTKGHIPLRNAMSLAVQVRDGWAHLVLANKEGGFNEEDARKADILVRLASIIIDRADLDQRERQARTEAERRAAQLESSMSSIADGVTLLDAQGTVIWMNEAGRNILGVPPDESFAGWAERFQRYTLDGEPIPLDQLAFYRALHGETVKDMCYRAVTPWGTEAILSVSAAPVRDPQGRVIGATNVFRDVRDRVSFERQRQELYEREHQIAETLQQALIPPQGSYRICDCELVLRYQPALKEAQVGGDFYDIFELEDGRIGMLIGDVAGKGLPAAMRVAEARYAVRSYAYLDSSPSRVMTLTNEALCRNRDDVVHMLTAFYAVVDTRRSTITYASAGHEPPVVLSAAGGIDRLSAAGLPLGIMTDCNYEEVTRLFEVGDRMVMFTDGITEARIGANLFGRENLEACLERKSRASLSEVASSLLEAASKHAGGVLGDDAAIIVFKFGANTYVIPEEFTIQLSSAQQDLAVCRAAIWDAAARAGFARTDLWGIVSAVFEASVNAITHGSSGNGKPTTLRICVYDDRLEAVVKDSGKGYVCPASTPLPPATAPRGRGIPLMRAFMDEVRFEYDNGCRVTLVKYRRNS